MKRDVDAIGCATQIVHRCVQNSCDMLPIEVQAIMVKLCRYFHVFTTRVAQVYCFYDEADAE
jgi:hypothetical protein